MPSARAGSSGAARAARRLAPTARRLLGEAAGSGRRAGGAATGRHRRLGAQARPRRARAGAPPSPSPSACPRPAVLGELRRAGHRDRRHRDRRRRGARPRSRPASTASCVQGSEAGGHRGTLDPIAEPDGDRPRRPRRAVRGLRRSGSGRRRRSSRRAASPQPSAPRRSGRPVRDAVQVGTALLLTPEAGTGLAYRRALADAAYDRTRGDPRLLRATGPLPRDRLRAPARRPGARGLSRGAPRDGAAATGLGPRRPARPRGAVGRHGLAARLDRCPRPRSCAELAALTTAASRCVDPGRARALAGDPAGRGGGIRCAPCPLPKETSRGCPPRTGPTCSPRPSRRRSAHVPGARVASIDADARGHGGVLRRLRRRAGGLGELRRRRGAPRRGGDPGGGHGARDRPGRHQPGRAQHLGVRKISFADQARAQELTGMEQGGITPVGLPAGWPVLVDAGVARGGAGRHRRRDYAGPSCSCTARTAARAPGLSSVMAGAWSAEPGRPWRVDPSAGDVPQQARALEAVGAAPDAEGLGHPHGVVEAGPGDGQSQQTALAASVCSRRCTWPISGSSMKNCSTSLPRQRPCSCHS